LRKSVIRELIVCWSASGVNFLKKAAWALFKVSYSSLPLLKEAGSFSLSLEMVEEKLWRL